VVKRFCKISLDLAIPISIVSAKQHREKQSLYIEDVVNNTARMPQHIVLNQSNTE
jgi:hypothetical protein